MSNFHEIALSVPAGRCEDACNLAQMASPYGFSLEDYTDLEQGAMEIAHSDLIDEDLLRRDRSRVVLRLYLPQEQNPRETADFLRERLHAAGVPYELGTSEVADSDWADNWKKYFKPTTVGERLLICPSWEEPGEHPGRAVLRLDPGAAFGTGTHATTRLCLELLERIVTPETAVLDIGAGSGILSLAAALLGAPQVLGIDIDPQAVKTARENAALNGCEDRAAFSAGDLTSAVAAGEHYQVVAANIVADVIIRLLDDLPRVLAPDGVFLCSGIIEPREPNVLDALAARGFKAEQVARAEGWVAMQIRNVEMRNNVR